MKVSIGIPFYNAENFLIEAIKSVYAQTHTDWELILVDDGSTDKSLSIAKSIKDSRVRVISDGKNRGLPARLNQIIDLSNCDYIVRMDADDLMMPDRIEKQIKIFKNNPLIDISSTGVFSVNNNLDLMGIRGYDFKNPMFIDVLARKVTLVHAAVIAKKSWYKRNRYNENLTLTEDLELWVRAAKSNDFRAMSIAEPLYIYREDNNVVKHKLLLSYKNERSIIRKYHAESAFTLLLKSYIKSILVILLSLFGSTSLLRMKRISRMPNIFERFSFNKAMRKINSIVIPLRDAE